MSFVGRLKRLKKLFSRGGDEPKKLIKYQIDEDSVRENKTIHDQQNQIAELQGELSRYRADEAAERESETDADEERAIKLDLLTQQKEIRMKEQGVFFSFKNFFGAYFGVPGYVPMGVNPKMYAQNFQKNLFFTTFNRSHMVARFGDIGLANGKFVICDDRRQPVLRGSEPKDIFFNPEAIGIDVQAMRIPICLDEEGGYVENPMIWKMSQAMYNDDKDAIEYTAARKQPFYKMIQEKDERIQELFESLGEKEGTIIAMQDKIDDLQLAYKSNEHSAQIARNEKTKIAKKASLIEKSFANMQEDLVKYQQIYTIQEDYNKKLETQFKKAMKEAEKIGATPSFTDAMEKMKDLLGLIKKSKIVPKETTRAAQDAAESSS